MVQSTDNLTSLRGTLIDRAPHPDLAGYELVQVQVERADPVPGRANLLGRNVGAVLPVAVRSVLLGSVLPGAALQLRAKLTPNGAMAEGDPEPGHFQVAP